MSTDYVAHLLSKPEELKEVVRRYVAAKQASKENRVAEIYSPPGVANRAEAHGLAPG